MGLYEKVRQAVRVPGTNRFKYVTRWRRKLLIRDWLYGDIVPIRKVPKPYRDDYERMLYAAAEAARAVGRRFEVSESFRTYAEQLHFWLKYQNGQGPIAAKPGSSLHEKGRALDFPDTIGKPGLRDDKAARAALEIRGFKFDVASEGWHASFYG